MGEHTDIHHSDVYYDSPHINIPHTDVPAYSDHADAQHSDSPHYDGYSDAPHYDLAHLDGTYSDYYSENVSDILKWILVELGKVKESDLDMVSFQDLRANRQQKLGMCINYFTTIGETIRALQTTGVFHLIILPSGKWVAKRYSTDEEISSLHDWDLLDISISQDPSNVQGAVSIAYDRDWGIGVYKYCTASDANTSNRYGIASTLMLESLLWDDEEASILANLYLAQTKSVRKKITANISTLMSDLSIASRVQFVLSKRLYNNRSVYILQDEIYRMKSITKNFTEGITTIEAISEPSLVGGFHADREHVDYYVDSYTDIEHSDVAHSDFPHSDTEHSDTEHSDVQHVDSYADYDDYSDHTDGLHQDRYSDRNYHWDTPHSDVPHADIEHSDSHGDTEHSDTPYQDSYSDEHGDIEHSDSYY